MQTFTITPDIIAAVKRWRDRLHPYESLDPEKTALIVIDMQNYFMADGEPGCAPAARDIVPNVNALAATVRATGGLVAWVQTEAKPDSPTEWANLYECYSPEVQATRQRSLAKDGSGFPLWHALEVGPVDARLIKTRYSAFTQSDMEAVLRKRGVETLLIAGVSTNVCCESTAREAMMIGFRTIMVSDGTAAFNQENHAHALKNFLIVFGDVQSTSEVIEHLSDHDGSGRSG